MTPKPAGLPPRRAPPVPAVPRGLNLSLPSNSQSPPGTAGERRRWKRRSLPLRSGRCVRCPCLCAQSGSKGQTQTAAESGGRGAEARMPPTLGPSPACRSGGEATARPPAPGLTSAEGTACTGEHLTAQMPTAHLRNAGCPARPLSYSRVPADAQQSWLCPPAVTTRVPTPPPVAEGCGPLPWLPAQCAEEETGGQAGGRQDQDECLSQGCPRRRLLIRAALFCAPPPRAKSRTSAEFSSGRLRRA